ncbi:MAG: phospholipase D family protein [Micrococcales bacterium]|nr:phospholipase D family protein [Micrococcales bacterium]
MALEDWFLRAAERGNPATVLDSRHGGISYTEGNEVRALIDGENYFTELRRAVQAQRAGDLLLFTDWRGDPDEMIGPGGPSIAELLSGAAARGVIVKGLFWRSHWDKLAYSQEQNRKIADDVRDAGGEVLLDMRVLPLGCHHQKCVVARYPGRPELDVAFVGGIDLCHTRGDTNEHLGDPQPVKMGRQWGPRPPWHDAQLQVQGPAVGDVEATFRERWDDPTPLQLNPIGLADAYLHGDDEHADPLPEQLPDPAPRGTAAVQVLRTYPAKLPRFPFAPDGERSIARAYDKTVKDARSLIYIEDQYFWSGAVVSCFAKALAANADLRLIVLVPRYANEDGRVSMASNLGSRSDALADVYAAGGDRVAVFSPENRAGTPVYVHAKVCVVDDVWATIGSDNVNRRSWTHDSELTCAVVDSVRDEREPRVVDAHGDGARRYARELRLQLAREHLDRPGDDPADVADLIDPIGAFEVFARSAATLQAWYDGGRVGPRPPGRLRPYVSPDYRGLLKGAAKLVYRIADDPDGRPLQMRLRGTF